MKSVKTYTTTCPRCSNHELTIEEYEVGSDGAEVTLIPDEASMEHLKACAAELSPIE